MAVVRKRAPAMEAGKAFALAAAQVAQARHCTDIVVLDIKAVSQAADYFVIATGTSGRQMQSVADEISDRGRKTGFARIGSAGYDQSKWICLDYVDVVVHLFDPEFRGYYDLEMLWGDATRVEIPEAPKEPAARKPRARIRKTAAHEHD